MFSKRVIIAVTAFATHTLAGLAFCDFNLTPSASANGIDLTPEFNYVIGRSVAIESPSHDSIGGPYTGIDNGDGTFTASGVAGTDGLTDDEVKALVLAWPGKILDGFSIRFWTVNSVTCQ